MTTELKNLSDSTKEDRWADFISAEEYDPHTQQIFFTAISSSCHPKKFFDDRSALSDSELGDDPTYFTRLERNVGPLFTTSPHKKESMMTSYSSAIRGFSSSSSVAEQLGAELAGDIAVEFEEKLEHELEEQLEENFKKKHIPKEDAERLADAAARDIAPAVALKFAGEAGKDLARDFAEMSESSEEVRSAFADAAKKMEEADEFDVVIHKAAKKLVHKIDELVLSGEEVELEEVVEEVGRAAASDVADRIEQNAQQTVKESKAARLQKRTVVAEQMGIVLQNALMAVIEAYCDSPSHAPILLLDNHLAALGIGHNAKELLEALHELRNAKSKEEARDGASKAMAHGAAIGEGVAATTLTATSLVELAAALEQLATVVDGLGAGMWGLDLVEAVALAVEGLEIPVTKEEKEHLACHLAKGALRLVRGGVEVAKDITLLTAHSSSALAALSIAAPMAAIPLELASIAILAHERKKEVRFLDEARKILNQRPMNSEELEECGPEFVENVKEFLSRHLEISSKELLELEKSGRNPEKHLKRMKNRKRKKFEKLVGKDAVKLTIEWLESGRLEKREPHAAAEILLTVMNKSWHQQVETISEIACASILVAGLALVPVSHGISLGAAGGTVGAFKFMDYVWDLNGRLAKQLVHGRDWSPTHMKAIVSELQALSGDMETNEMIVDVEQSPSAPLSRRKRSRRHSLLERARGGARRSASSLRSNSAIALDSARSSLEAGKIRMRQLISELRRQEHL